MDDRVGFMRRIGRAIRRWWNGATPSDQPTRRWRQPYSAPAQPAPVRRLALWETTGDLENAITIPSEGDVFWFRLVPSFRWSSNDLDLETLRVRSSENLGAARNEAVSRVWRVGREFSPTDTAAAEIAINEKLIEGWCYNVDEVEIRCSAKMRVVIDARLAEHLLPFGLNRAALLASHEYTMQRADLVKERATKWLEVISELDGRSELTPASQQFLLPFAAELSDEKFAAVTRQLSNMRNARAVDLANVLANAGQGHQNANLFEFAAAYDTAHQTFRRQMGLPPFRLEIFDPVPEPEDSE